MSSFKQNMGQNSYLRSDVNYKIILHYLTPTLSTGIKIVLPDIWFDAILFKWKMDSSKVGIIFATYQRMKEN